MRDERFKASHRGGPLDLHRHRLLSSWAADCADHVLHLFSKQYPQDDRPRRAIEAARAWAHGEITVGEARTVALDAHAAARNVADGAAQPAARAAGHAAATAHMADHALQAAAYAIKAVQASVNRRDDVMAADRERTWQYERLPDKVRALVLSTSERQYDSG